MDTCTEVAADYVVADSLVPADVSNVLTLIVIYVEKERKKKLIIFPGAGLG